MRFLLKSCYRGGMRIMIYYDNTQSELRNYLNCTESTFNKLLSTMNGQAVIKTCTDLGFPHDVIRIAGGFATGAYVKWNSTEPIIPIDTCVNVCSCSFFEIDHDILNIFSDTTFMNLNDKLKQGIYVNNFHRGNHFIAYLQSINSDKLYLLLHSSASEFKDNFNGLYPVKENWFYNDIQVFRSDNSYIRYIKGKKAELFYNIAKNLVHFNENRHEIIANTLLNNISKIINIFHFHHYYMPDENSVVMGSHILSPGQIAPILSIPGANIYMVQFKKAKDNELYIGDHKFLTPHGWGKRHKNIPNISLDIDSKTFSLDSIDYKIKFGESLRAHPSLELRDFKTKTKSRKNSFFDYLGTLYDYTLVDEMKQIASYNKAGVIKW